MKKISLFDIGQEFHQLHEMANTLEFNEDTGEITDNTEILKELFDEMGDTLINKLDSCEYIRRELEAGSKTLGDEIKRLQNKKKALDNRANGLKLIMQDTIIKTDTKKLKGKFNFNISNRKSLSIQSNLTPEFFNKEYIRVKREFDKTKITKALKDGLVIDGAELVDKTVLTVR